MATEQRAASDGEKPKMNIEAVEPAASSGGAQLGKSGILIAAWCGTVTLGEVQQVLGILTGVAVLVYTLINIYIAWRDKLRKPSQKEMA